MILKRCQRTTFCLRLFRRSSNRVLVIVVDVAYDYTHRGLSFSTATYVPSRCLNISSTVDNSTLSSCSLMDRPREVDNIGHKGKYFMLQWKRYHFELLSESYSSKYASQEARDKFKKTRMVNYIARL